MLLTRRGHTLSGWRKTGLLVNAWVDPSEVVGHLPDQVRPHLGANGGVVVGCCMIELERMRPWPMPPSAGVTMRAAAHRISCEVGPVQRPSRAVFVPVRHTDSRLAVLAGGRAFPGVHLAADIDVQADQELRWRVARRFINDRFSIMAQADLSSVRPATSEVADIVIGTRLGLSPAHRGGALEAVEMRLDDLTAAQVNAGVDSAFMADFRSAEPAETLLMTDVGVRWCPVGHRGPRHG